MGILTIHPRIHTAFTSFFIISIEILHLLEMATKIKVEPEEMQLSTSGGGEQEIKEEQVEW